MKKSTLVSSFKLVFILLLSTSMYAQNFRELDKSPMDVSAFPLKYRNPNKDIKIYYSRPQLKGRPLSQLTPKGKIWRLGANEAAELILYKDMKLGSTSIKAGSYSFYAIPGDKEWTVIVSKDTNVWGAYNYNQANDAARLNIPVTKASESLEAFSIAFTKANNGINMHLGWDTTRVVVPFTK